MMESSGSVFGAEVEGVNWSEPLPQSTVDDVSRINYLQHLSLII